MRDGGPAFPIANAVFNADAPDSFEQFKAATSQSQGMSLRDWFAGKALPEAIRQTDAVMWNPQITIKPEPRSNAARIAYELADAMLTERQPPKPPLEVTEADREQGATDMERAYPRREPT